MAKVINDMENRFVSQDSLRSRNRRSWSSPSCGLLLEFLQLLSIPSSYLVLRPGWPPYIIRYYLRSLIPLSYTYTHFSFFTCANISLTFLSPLSLASIQSHAPIIRSSFWNQSDPLLRFSKFTSLISHYLLVTSRAMLLQTPFICGFKSIHSSKVPSFQQIPSEHLLYIKSLACLLSFKLEKKKTKQIKLVV